MKKIVLNKFFNFNYRKFSFWSLEHNKIWLKKFLCFSQDIKFPKKYTLYYKLSIWVVLQLKCIKYLARQILTESTEELDNVRRKY